MAFFDQTSAAFGNLLFDFFAIEKFLVVAKGQRTGKFIHVFALVELFFHGLAIAAQKGINLYAVKGEWQLDGTIQSKIMAMVFAMAAEIERDLISQRTKEALRVKKAAGVKLGRPRGPGKSKLDPYQPEIEALLANGSTQKFIAHRYGTTEGNLHNWLKKRGLKQVKT